MSKKIKVLFVLPTLGAGGAERIMSFVAGHLDTNHFKTHLLVIGYKSQAAFEIKNLKTTFLNKKRVLSGIPALVIFILKFKPNIVVSSISHLNTVIGLIAPFFSNCKFIIREASVSSIMGKFANAGRIYGKLAKIAYKNINGVICQSQDMADDFIKRFNIPSNKIYIINNPITEVAPIKNKTVDANLKKFITVGRLSKEKGHLRILELLAKINIPFQYTIVGDGPDKENIMRRIEELGLSSYITHIPFTNKVSEELCKHDIFMQGSYVEGFPNAVLESCVVGTPVIAFNVPGGTKEIIRNGVNGFLVATEEEFMKKILDCEDLEPRIIRESVIDRFNKIIILSKFEKLFYSLQ